jgi:hypothetical protein
MQLPVIVGRGLLLGSLFLLLSSAKAKIVLFRLVIIFVLVSLAFLHVPSHDAILGEIDERTVAFKELNENKGQETDNRSSERINTGIVRQTLLDTRLSLWIPPISFREIPERRDSRGSS